MSYKKIGIIYDKSSAIAVAEKMALAATGLARSNKPGRMLNIVVAQIAPKGVCVKGFISPKENSDDHSKPEFR